MVLIALSTSVPNGLVIQFCSDPWMNVFQESALEAAELMSAAAEPVSGTTLATLLLAPNNESKLLKSASTGSQPLEVVKSPSAAVKSVPSVGSMLEIELMIGSMISSNSSACADGVMANGDMPNAKKALALAIKPTTAR
ncbi:MAG: hypothetical protein ACLPLP_12555, partial [Mycobacterium sp.]